MDGRRQRRPTGQTDHRGQTLHLLNDRRTKEQQSRRSNNRQCPSYLRTRQITDVSLTENTSSQFEKMSMEKEMSDEPPKDVAAEAAAAAAAASVAEDNGKDSISFVMCIRDVDSLLNLTY